MILTSYFSEISSCIGGHLMVSTTTLSLSLSTRAYSTSPHLSEKWSLLLFHMERCLHSLLSSWVHSESLPTGPDDHQAHTAVARETNIDRLYGHSRLCPRPYDSCVGFLASRHQWVTWRVGAWTFCVSCALAIRYFWDMIRCLSFLLSLSVQ